MQQQFRIDDKCITLFLIDANSNRIQFILNAIGSKIFEVCCVHSETTAHCSAFMIANRIMVILTACRLVQLYEQFLKGLMCCVLYLYLTISESICDVEHDVFVRTCSHQSRAHISTSSHSPHGFP